MIMITMPLQCKECNEEMSMYKINRTSKKIIFTCPKGHCREVTENEYLEEVQASDK